MELVQLFTMWSCESIRADGALIIVEIKITILLSSTFLLREQVVERGIRNYLPNSYCMLMDVSKKYQGLCCLSPLKDP